MVQEPNAASFFIWDTDGQGYFPATADTAGALGKRIFFEGRTNSDSELWSSNANGIGAALFADLWGSGSSKPGYFCAANGDLYFHARDDAGTVGHYVTDGTNTPVRIGEAPGPEAATMGCAAAGGFVYFAGEFDRSLMKTNGTASGTSEVWSSTRKRRDGHENETR
ncbi:MAG TPA: hypothetical protein VM925_18995 [Labilithrix sp.]|jgi:hypothetical protein|nr:hypothetical protein [Labilithrix sp.]